MTKWTIYRDKNHSFSPYYGTVKEVTILESTEIYEKKPILRPQASLMAQQ